MCWCILLSSLFTFDPKTSPPTPDGDEEAHLLDRVPPGGHRERLPELLAKLAAPHVHPEDDDYDDDRHDGDCDGDVDDNDGDNRDGDKEQEDGYNVNIHVDDMYDEIDGSNSNNDEMMMS